MTCTILNSDKPASIAGTKTISNVDMSWASDGAPVSGWVIYLDQNQNGVLDADERSTTTDTNGDYSFSNLIGGVTYYVKEVLNSLGGGWEQVSGAEPVNLAMGAASAGNNFVNKAYGNIVVVKNVVNENGQVTKDATNWTWNYDGAEQDGFALTTGSTNSVKVPAGSYVVSENQQANYTVKLSSCSGEETDPTATATTHQSVVVSPGETVVCTFTNARDSGTIEVKKVVQSADPDEAGVFDLLVDGVVKAEDVANGGTTGQVPVATGQAHAVAEAAGTETDMNRYDSFYQCFDGRTLVKMGNGTAVEGGITVSKGQHVVCTFTNTAHALIAIVKDANPDASQPFDFNINGGRQGLDEDFTLVDDGSEESNNTEIIEVSALANYTVTESEVAGWVLTNISCEGEGRIETENPLELALQPTPGTIIVCTFTNTKKASLTVVKDAQPNATVPFSFTTDAVQVAGADATFSLVDDGALGVNSKLFTGLMPGRYTVTETATEGWTLNDIRCTNAVVERAGLTAHITLSAGAEAVCTFVNQKKIVPQVLGATTVVPPAPKLQDTGASLLWQTVLSVGLIGTTLWVVTRKQNTESILKKRAVMYSLL